MYTRTCTFEERERDAETERESENVCSTSGNEPLTKRRKYRRSANKPNYKTKQ